MSNVGSLLSAKEREILSISPDATVMDAAALMNEHKIGALVVCEQGRIVGMFTERDVLRRVVALRRDPAEVKIRDAMTKEVVVCEPGTSIEEARSIFRDRRIRHLPVVDDDGKLKGMVSIGDINAWQLDGAQATIHYFEEYIYGRV